MLSTSTVLPDSALFELIIASNYAANGCEVEFIEESKGRNRTPDLKLTWRDLSTSLVVECKRLGRGQYEKDEQERHRHLFHSIAVLIDVCRLSVHIDVSYTRELAVVPETYLLDV